MSRGKKAQKKATSPESPSGTGSPAKKEYKRDVIIETTAKLMVPLILLFGMYIIVGTEGTGGGFPGGCILAAGFILYITAFGTDMGRERMPESWNAFFKSFGLYLYCGAGFLAVIFSLGSAQFLNYSAVWPLARIVGIAVTRGYLLAFMVSVGIGITVMGAFISQFFDLAWRDEEEEKGEQE
jgi:multicomponent Na+:H+ antiporter subunit B